MRFFRLSLSCLLVSALALAAVSTGAEAAQHAAADQFHPSLYHRSKYAVKEASSAPREWRHDSSVAFDRDAHHVTLQIAVKRQRVSELHARALAVSTPGSALYGQHLSQPEVSALVSPSSTSVGHVEAWLAAHGVDLAHVQRSANNDLLRVTLPVSKVEALLNTQYRPFRHQQSDRVMLRATTYQLPAVLHEHVDTVQPTTSFSSHTDRQAKKQQHHHVQLDHAHAHTRAKRAFHAKGVSSLVAPVPAAGKCNVTQTLDCIRTIYNALGYNATSNGQNSVALAEFLGEAVNQADLTEFLRIYRPEAVGASFNLVQVNQNYSDNPSQSDKYAADPDIESNLDAQLITGVAWPTPLTVFSTAGSPPFIPDIATPTNTNEPYLEYTTFLLNQTTLPYVISHSYGDDEQTVPEDYATRVCDDFATLAARGISILFSSGDNGVGANCTTLNGTTAFIPAFPASCPWVTTVGATGYYPEKAVVRFKSGSGFSNYFAQPSYQSTAVASYLNYLNGTVASSLFNASGRAYPDVAAYGNRDWIVNNITYPHPKYSGNVTIGGTSASSPTFAGFVALLNDYRISNGLPTLGFLNPFIYQFGYLALNDITVGDSYMPGCSVDNYYQGGFPAAAGWDPVTGWGTPNFVKLQSASVLALQGSV